MTCSSVKRTMGHRTQARNDSYMTNHIGIRYTFPCGTIVEMTYFQGCVGTPEAWVKSHMSRPGKAKKERFESDVPLHRRTEPDGTVTDEPVPVIK